MAYSAYPIRTLAGLLACLSIVLLVGVLSLPTAWSAISASCIALIGLAAIAWLTSQHRRLQATSNAVIASMGAQTLDLPTGLRNRMPLIVVIGDGLDRLFDDRAEQRRVIVGEGAIWVRLDQPAALRETVLALRVCRGGREPDGVLLSLAPDCHANDDAVAEGLRIARGAVSDAAHALGRSLPCFLAVYQRWSTGTDDASQLRWHGLAQGDGLSHAEAFEEVVLAAELRVQRAKGDIRAAWAASGLAATIEWTRRTALAVLTDSREPSAPCRLHAIGWTDQGPATTVTSPLALRLVKRTGITPPSFPANDADWPLPQPLILGAPLSSWIPPWVRGFVAGFVLVMLFLAAALWISLQRNHLLLERVGDDLARLRGAVHAGIDEKHQALGAVKADRDEIDHYARLGVPWAN